MSNANEEMEVGYGLLCSSAQLDDELPKAVKYFISLLDMLIHNIEREQIEIHKSKRSVALQGCPIPYVGDSEALRFHFNALRLLRVAVVSTAVLSTLALALEHNAPAA